MIQMIVTYTCGQCENPHIVRNGHDDKGSQKYHCKACGRYSTLNAQTGYDAARQAWGVGALKFVGTIAAHHLAGWIEALPPLHTSLLPAEIEDVLELDELWSFVGSKAQERWLWLALCRRTRQVVAYWIGVGRRPARCNYGGTPRDYVRCASFSDGWQPYRFIFDSQRRRMVSKAEGETCHVERFFNTLRQRLARFTRKTLASSKCDDLHDGLLQLFIYHYNLSCIS